MDPLVTAHLDQLREAAEAHGVIQVRIFGSRATGKANDNSDIDLLVRLEPGRSLWDLADFRADLEDVLGCRVDVVTEAALSPYLRDHILAQAVELYPEAA